MAQTSQRSYGGAERGGMGSLFAGIIEGWDGVGKIFDDVGVMQRERQIKDQAAKQEATDKANAAAGSTKLSTALLDSPDTGNVQTTQTGATPYTGARLAGTAAIPVTAPAGGPSGTATAEPVLKPGGAIPARPVDPYLAANPQAGANAPPTGASAWAKGMTGAPAVPYAGEAAERSNLAAPPAAAAPDPTDPGSTDYGGGSDATGKESSAKIPSFGMQPAQPQAQITPTAEAVPTGVGTTLGVPRPYADAGMGQSLLGLGAIAGRRRGLGAPDFAMEQQQAIATAPQVAPRARPRVAQQQVIPALLPQVDIFGNPIMPVRNV